MISTEAQPGPSGRDQGAIRFLGLWDCVPSFGTASIPLNIGWELDFPATVQKCFHALALNARRHTFRLHRLNAQVDDADGPGVLYELWFRGVRSDVGGGNETPVCPASRSTGC